MLKVISHSNKLKNWNISEKSGEVFNVVFTCSKVLPWFLYSLNFDSTILRVIFSLFACEKKSERLNSTNRRAKVISRTYKKKNEKSRVHNMNVTFIYAYHKPLLSSRQIAGLLFLVKLKNWQIFGLKQNKTIASSSRKSLVDQ